MVKINEITNGFTNIAKILVPTATFGEITITTTKVVSGERKGSLDVDCKAVGFDEITNCRVEVLTILDNPARGSEIAVRYYHHETDELLIERRVWSFAFNWTALSKHVTPVVRYVED